MDAATFCEAKKGKTLGGLGRRGVRPQGSKKTFFVASLNTLRSENSEVCIQFEISVLYTYDQRVRIFQLGIVISI